MNCADYLHLRDAFFQVVDAKDCVSAYSTLRAAEIQAKAARGAGHLGFISGMMALAGGSLAVWASIRAAKIQTRLQERVERAHIVAARRGWTTQLAVTRQRTITFKETIGALRTFSSETPNKLAPQRPDFGWISAAITIDTIGETALRLDVDFDILGNTRHAISEFRGVFGAYLSGLKYLGVGNRPFAQLPAHGVKGSDVCLVLDRVLKEFDALDLALKTKPLAFKG